MIQWFWRLKKRGGEAKKTLCYEPGQRNWTRQKQFTARARTDFKNIHCSYLARKYINNRYSGAMNRPKGFSSELGVNSCWIWFPRDSGGKKWTEHGQPGKHQKEVPLRHLLYWGGQSRTNWNPHRTPANSHWSVDRTNFAGLSPSRCCSSRKREDAATVLVTSLDVCHLVSCH